MKGNMKMRMVSGKIGGNTGTLDSTPEVSYNPFKIEVINQHFIDDKKRWRYSIQYIKGNSNDVCDKFLGYG